MEELKKCIRDAASFLDRTAGLIDENGMVVSCTDETMEGREDSASRAVLMGDDLLAVTNGQTYIRLTDQEKASLLCFVEGADSVAQNYAELLAGWLRSAMKQRNTKAERDNFLKNVLLENELPGDVPLKAREFKIPYSSPRLAYLIRIDREEELDGIEILQSMFPNRSAYVLPMDEETIVLLAEHDPDDPDAINTMASRLSIISMQNRWPRSELVSACQPKR